MEEKEHLTFEGIQKLVAINSSINRGLSDQLKAAFPKTIPVQRPIVVENPKIPHHQWLAGFTSGEGCFRVMINKSNTKVGWTVQLVFQITQQGVSPPEMNNWWKVLLSI